MAKWLSKYEQGGLVLKQKTKDNYDLKANPNNVQASVGPGYVGLGYNTKGRNYSPAWGGQFQNGGKKKKKDIQDKVEDWLGNPMQKAEITADKYTKPGEDQVDNIRHPMAGRYVSEAIQNKLYNIPGISQIAGFLGASAAGLGHELVDPNRGAVNRPYSLYDTFKEGAEDQFNNMIGAAIGSTPFISKDQKDKVIKYLSDKNMLPDGYRDKDNMYRKHDMGGKLQNGDTLPEKVLVHDPQDYEGGHMYALKKTVTPYKTNQKIKKYTKAATNPEDIDFLHNYRHTYGVDNKNATAVPYEGDRHWNIDRFITDPAFGTGYTKLQSDDDSMEAERRNVLADMFKYQMFQHPEQSRGKSFRQAKRFVRKEIDPRVSGPYFQNYMREGVYPVYPPGTGGLTTFTNSNPFFAAWSDMQEGQAESDANREYRKNPWDEAKIEKVAKDYLKNTKKLSRKETKEQIKKWKTESKSMIQDYFNSEPTPQTGGGEPTKEYAMGGGIPGAVGFTYARTAGAAPSNGKYAKKTKASAQNGKVLDPKADDRATLDFNTSDPAFQYVRANSFVPFDTKDFEGIKQNIAGYMKSPLYSKRLSLSIPDQELAKDVQQQRLDNLLSVKLNPKSVDGGTNYNPITNRVNIGASDFVDNPTIAHEVAHGMIPNRTLSYGKQNLLSKAANVVGDLFQPFEQFSKSELEKINIPLSGRVTAPNASYQRAIQEEHYAPQGSRASAKTAANETYGDLTGIRQLLLDNGITTEFGQDLTPELWEKAKKNPKINNEPHMQRMRLRFKDEDIIKMNNEVAYNNANNRSFDQAQNGKEMSFYQQGLDFTPKNISKNGSVIKDDMGQWAHPGEITEINSNDITMEGVDYPVLGISDTGDVQMMYPDQDYKFDGEKVTEFPMMQKGGWLNKYANQSDATKNLGFEQAVKAQQDRYNRSINPANQPSVSQWNPKLGEVEAQNAREAERLRDYNSWDSKFSRNPNVIKGTKNLSDAGMFALDVMTLGEGALATKGLLKNAYTNIIDDAVKAGSNAVKRLDLTKYNVNDASQANFVNSLFSELPEKFQTNNIYNQITNFAELNKQHVAKELSRRHGSLRKNQTTNTIDKVVSPDVRNETLRNIIAFDNSADRTLNKAGNFENLRFSDNSFISSLKPIKNKELLKGIRANYRKNQNGGWLNKYTPKAQTGITTSTASGTTDPTVQLITQEDIKKAKKKAEADTKEAFAAAAKRDRKNQAYISKDRSTPASRAADQQMLTDAYMAEAQRNSPLAQTFASWAPGGTDVGTVQASQFSKTLPIVAGGAAGMAVLPEVLAGLAANIGGIPGLTGNNIINAGLAYQGLTNIPNVASSISNAYQNPTWGNVGDATAETVLTGLNVLPFAATVAPEVRAAIEASKESGLLSKAHNYNPWQWQPEETSAFRMIGGEPGVEDLVISGKVRPSVKGSDIGKIHEETSYSLGVPYNDVVYPKYGRQFNRPFEGPYMVEVPNYAENAALSYGPAGKQLGAQAWTYPNSQIGINDVNLYKKHWLKGQQLLKSKLANAAEDATGYPIGYTSTTMLDKVLGRSPYRDRVFDAAKTLFQQVVGKYKKGEENKAAIAEGNEWLKNWIQSEATKDKLTNRARSISYSFSQHPDIVSKIRTLQNFTPVTSEYPIRANMDDFLGILMGGKEEMVHQGNIGVAHRYPLSFSSDQPKFRIGDKSSGPGTWMNRSTDISAPQRTSSTVHEGVHDWFRHEPLTTFGYKDLIRSSITDDALAQNKAWLKSGSRGTGLGYYADPTEVHARIMQTRHYFGLTPETHVTPKMAEDMLKIIEKGNTPIKSKFPSVFDDYKKAANLFNKLPAVVPVAVGVGALGAAGDTKQEQKNGGWLNKYK